MQKLFQRIKNTFKKQSNPIYKKIVLVDTENVGCKAFKPLENIYIYYFVNSTAPDSFIKEVSQHRTNSEIVYLDDTYHHERNAMDFCIVAKLSEILSNTNKSTSLFILSKDTGYEDAIKFLQDTHKDRYIRRCDSYVNMIENRKNLNELLRQTPKPIRYRINQLGVQNKITEFGNMKALKKHLTDTVYDELFTLRRFKNLIIEFDIYEGKFIYFEKKGEEREIIEISNNFNAILMLFQDECRNRYGISILSHEIYVSLSTIVNQRRRNG